MSPANAIIVQAGALRHADARKRTKGTMGITYLEDSILVLHRGRRTKMKIAGDKTGEQSKSALGYEFA